MKKYRRIEVKAFRRRVTIVSGISGQRPGHNIHVPPPPSDDQISLNDSDLSKPVEPDIREGLLILVEAMRSLERCLSADARAAIYADQNKLVPNRPNRNGFYLKLQSFYQFIRPKALRIARKEK